LPLPASPDSFRENQQEDGTMAKGQMRPNKETRKPKKDAKKAVPAAPVLKAAPVPAMKIKDKTK
jgi:hypothetical protein